MRGAFDQPRWELLELWGSGDRGVAKFRLEGTLGGVQIAQVMWQAGRLRDGKLGWWAFFRSEPEALAAAGITQDQIDWLVPHQANVRIIQSTARKLGLDMDKVILTVAQHGNTSGASIPLALDFGVRSGKIHRGHNLVLEGVGGGFTWGAVVLRF